MNIGIGLQIDQQSQTDSQVLYLCAETGDHILDENGNYIIF